MTTEHHECPFTRDLAKPGSKSNVVRVPWHAIFHGCCCCCRCVMQESSLQGETAVVSVMITGAVERRQIEHYAGTSVQTRANCFSQRSKTAPTQVIIDRIAETRGRFSTMIRGEVTALTVNTIFACINIESRKVNDVA